MDILYKYEYVYELNSIELIESIKKKYEIKKILILTLIE